MDPVQILFPIFPLIFLTYLHTFFNANTVRKAIQTKELDWRWMKFMPSWQQIPDDVQASREHYKNLYQAQLRGDALDIETQTRVRNDFYNRMLKKAGGRRRKIIRKKLIQAELLRRKGQSAPTFDTDGVKPSPPRTQSK